ncbi:MAG: hypothetical protein E7519_02460 [Ruminococcaceae bacterium]|nr:hypothetical protein [Oscillospiraceae bacterium]
MKWLLNLLKTENRLGFRVVKTGIAVTLCVVISALLKLDEPFFAVIAAVMTMGKSIDASIKMGKNKLIGVLIGAAVGYGFVMLSPGNAGLCGVGIILTLYLCHLFKLYGAATLSCFVFAAMMFHIGTALSCIAGSAIGIVIAILVNLVIMPPNYAEEIKKSFVHLRSQVDQAMESAASFWQIDTFAVDSAIQKLSYNVKMYIAQAKFLRWNDDEVFGISCKISTYEMILDELKALEVMELTEDSVKPGGETGIVYRYHMDRMQKLYEHALSETEEANKK